MGGFNILFLKLRRHVGDAMIKFGSIKDDNVVRGPRSLANRVLLLQFVWAMVVYFLVIAAMWYAANSVIESSLRSQSHSWVNKLDEMGIPFYVSDKSSTMKEGLTDLRNFPDLIGVRYLDANGKNVIAEYRRHNYEKVAFTVPNSEILEKLSSHKNEKNRPIEFISSDDDYIRLIAPLWIKSIASDGLFNFSMEDGVSEKRETIGYISVILDYSSASNTLNKSLIIASIIIALLMLMAAITGRVLIRWALRPLSRLEEPLTRLANGETDVTVESSGDREIAQIGRALNTTINALRERDETLLRMANHDALTGLINRKHFIELLEEEIQRVGLEEASSALFFFDLDRFKHINDTYGHSAGDRLLVQIADMLRTRLRDNDVLARLGGDEFVAIIRNVNRKVAQEIGTSLLAKMQDFTFYEGVDAIKIYFSIGITMITDGRATPHHYLKQADAAVHEAKSQGRNRYFVYEPDVSSADGNIESGWYERIRDAIENEQFHLYFQPLMGLRGQGGRIFEVLLRLPDVRHGVLVPGGFFPAAERFGLMPEMDRMVLRKSLEMLAKHKDPGLILSINFSGHIFEDDGFVDTVEELLAEYKVEPQRLIFEISEQVAVRHMERLRPMFHTLVARGIRCAIDDFGSGFASFSYVKQFPVQCLKINGALIERVAVDSVDKITVSTIVAMASELGMETVAKFVPNEESVQMLRGMGIDYVQGDFVGEPEPSVDRVLRPQLNVVK